MRRHAGHEELAEFAQAAFGGERRLAAVARLRGGSKKGVYRLTFDDGFSAIAYVWSPSEDYWSVGPDGPDSAPDHTDPFSHASGLQLFAAAYDRLVAVGVRTPRVYLAGRRASYPADVAIVEDVPGENLEDLLRRDPAAAEPTVRRLAEALDLMRRQRGPGFGKVALLDRGGVSVGESCERVVLDRALADLDEAAARDPRIAAARDRLAAVLDEFAAAVRPRAEHVLVHGEIGPDHVLVDRDGRPVLIDIEGLMYFDVEWEHVFLRIRFGEHYRWLSAPDLDEHRLALYLLAQRLSLVAGPLRLLDGDFPDREFMLGIAEHNLRQALTFAR